METNAIWAFVLLAMAAPTAAVWGNFEKEYRGGYERSGALVHLMEWSYKDIMNECASLDWNGYYGIIISPPVEHVEIKDNPDWKERYMPISLTSFTTRSGTEVELRAMLARCVNWNSLRIFVDLNLNNMLKSTETDLVGFGGTKANPSKYEYEGIGEKQFHAPCNIQSREDMQDSVKVRECKVDDLQDLVNCDPVVKKAHVDMMNRLVDMGVFGFRIVMARHMYPLHLYNIYLDLKKTFINEKPYIIHDINDLDDYVVKSNEYSLHGMTTDYAYGAELYKYFMGQPDRDLKKLLHWGGIEVDDHPKARGSEPLVFLYTHENQDSDEVLKPSHGKYYRMALAFMMAFPYGIPMVLSTYDGRSAPQTADGNTASPRPSNVWPDSYSYTCTDKFACEHRLDTTIMMTLFKAEVRERKLSWMEKNEEEHWFAFARGERGFIYFNAGTTSKERTFKNLPLKPGRYCDLATGEIVDYGSRCTGQVITIKDDKSTTITLNADDPYGYVAIMTRAYLNPLKTTAAAVYNNNPVTKFLLRFPAKLVLTIVNTVMEVGEKVTENYYNPDKGVAQAVAAGVGAVGSRTYKSIYDLTESVGRRMVSAIQHRVTDAAKNALEKKMNEQLDGSMKALKEALTAFDLPSYDPVDDPSSTK